MNKAKALVQMGRYFGWRWVAFRVTYSIKIRTGHLRRALPAYEWHERPLAFWLKDNTPSSPDEYIVWRKTNGVKFFFDSVPDEYPLGNSHSDELITSAEAILKGQWPYFTGQVYDIGMPPNWHLNPFTGQSVLPDRHWTLISDFGAGDIKFIWEASRFSVVYTLVRAYTVSKDTRYANAFWQLVGDWAGQNPPQMGPNWKCGQEATFRVMAWCFGLHAFADVATSEQISNLITMIASHGERIAGNIDYARSQNNNHGISEGVGLWTIGVLFPEFKQSEEWRELGKRIFEGEMRRQVFDDGSYAQYSPNYQRVMLHDAIWALRLGELNKQQFPKDIYEKVSKSALFLLEILDPVSGFVPNHGANDSALVLPLNDSNARDFRPVIQAAHYLTNKERLFERGYEDLFWLFGKEALDSPKFMPLKQDKHSAVIGGYYTLHGDESWLMVRCANYRARPHHADQLHVDLWWKGINVLCDAGTYLYNGTPPWNNGLATSTVHNTVSVDNLDQMTAYSRFLWLDWSRGNVHHHDDSYWEGSHDGYLRLKSPVACRRAIQRLGNDAWLIADELSSDKPHNYRLHWLLPKFPYNIYQDAVSLETNNGYLFLYFSQSVGFRPPEEGQTEGWRSTTYAEKQPALSFTLSTTTESSIVFWTVFSPTALEIKNTKGLNRLQINDIQVTLGREKLIEIERS